MVKLPNSKLQIWHEFANNLKDYSLKNTSFDYQNVKVSDPKSMVNCLVKRALLCFDENTQVLIQDGYKATGSKIPMHQLTVGDMILSVKENHIFYDEVTKCSTVEGKFAAINFEFENGKSITVTSNHLMLVFNGDELEMTPAKDVQLNDVMYFEDGTCKYSESDGFSNVTGKCHVVLDRKIHVNTKSGLFFSNNLLTTGMCENIPKTLPGAAKSIMKKRMVNHLIKNTEFPKTITLWLDQMLHMTISMTDCYS